MWPSSPAATRDPPHAPSPTVALDEDRAPMACRLVALPSPASRPSTPRRAFSQPRAGLDTARRRPAQPGSSCIGAQTGLRAAIDPTAYAVSAAQRAPVARSAGLRPVRAALSPPVGRPSALGRLDSALNPALGGPCRRLSRPPAVAQAARQLPAPTLPGTPGTPTPAPRSVPGTTGARGHP